MRASFYHAENDIHISRCCIKSIHVLAANSSLGVTRFGVSTDGIVSCTLLNTLETVLKVFGNCPKTTLL